MYFVVTISDRTGGERMKRCLYQVFLRPAHAAVVAWAVGFILLLILGANLGPGVLRSACQVFAKMTAGISTIISPSPLIVERLQSLNRLETARQITSQVVEASAERPFLPAFLGKDKLLMSVQTESVAGVDLSGFAHQDVRVTNGAVTVRLPAPQVFSIRVDDEHSKVYSRERGWLVLNPNTDLERQARLSALSDARSAARKEVMSAARTNAENNLRVFMRSLGFQRVVFEWADRSA